MKQAKVFLNNALAGILTEDDTGYEFRYDTDYLKADGAIAVSLTLPLTDKPYRDKVLFPFFDGRGGADDPTVCGNAPCHKMHKYFVRIL